ncbi:MAG: hypothetical protein C0P79_011575 [Gammaproteobacteria bacterium]
MRARTEDLLTLRDGEPIDAALRERLLADPENRREIDRLTRVAEELRRLPPLEPPPDVWPRIVAAAAERNARPWKLRAAGFAGALVAVAMLVAAAVIAPWQCSPDDATVASVTAPRDVAAAPARDAEPPSRVTGNTLVTRADYAPLVAESVRLERLLAELDGRPRRINAGTAFTIANLEDHLVLLDDALTYAEARDLDPDYRRLLWRERVDVMNALMHVRYAHYQEVAF